MKQRADGRYSAAIRLANGKRVTFYGKTQREVLAKQAAARKQRDAGIAPPDARQTLGPYLADWLDGARPQLRASSVLAYEVAIRLHLTPALGKRRLVALTPVDIQHVYRDKLAAGFAPTTIRIMHAVLHRALEQAYRWGMVQRNVADLVSPPSVPRQETEHLTLDQVVRLFRAAEGDRLEALYVLAVMTGMRQGELIGLRWQDVDLARGFIVVATQLQRRKGEWVRSEPKTPTANRGLLLDPLSRDQLRRHAEGASGELVFPSRSGTPYHPADLRKREWLPLLERAGIPPLRFHALRHTNATLSMRAGIPARIVAARLGHSKVGITLDTYSHATDEMGEQAAMALFELVSVRQSVNRAQA